LDSPGDAVNAAASAHARQHKARKLREEDRSHKRGMREKKIAWGCENVDGSCRGPHQGVIPLFLACDEILLDLTIDFLD
jgi:hypothetical protein